MARKNVAPAIVYRRTTLCRSFMSWDVFQGVERGPGRDEVGGFMLVKCLFKNVLLSGLSTSAAIFHLQQGAVQAGNLRNIPVNWLAIMVFVNQAECLINLFDI